MNRRNFLKLLLATIFSVFFLPMLSFAKTLPKKVLIAIKKGKYPGKIKAIDKIKIKNAGKWIG